MDYGATEDRLIFPATLCAAEVTGGTKEPLVSILTGPAIGGDGYAVLAADGATLANRVSFVLAAEVARAAAWRVRDMGLSGLTFECSPLGEIQLRRKPLPRNNKA
ncbi:hypothetical protein [Variovorax soli]|uniref:hypothetical protein n=1 Tax=Variovorax soli TaxID=376815 RepID=UPI00129477A8|nr:hypothetical protein [Variovorax soli]